MEFMVNTSSNYLLDSWTNCVMWKGNFQTFLKLVLLFLHLVLPINVVPPKLCGLMMDHMCIWSCLILILFHLNFFQMLQLLWNFMITTYFLSLLVYLKFKLLLIMLSISFILLVLLFFKPLVPLSLLVKPLVLALMLMLVKPLVLSIMLMLVKTFVLSLRLLQQHLNVMHLLS